MSLQVWLPLDGNIKQQGISNIEMIGTPTSWDSNGKIGKCAYWNKDTSKALYNNTTDFYYTNNFSVAFWAKPIYDNSTEYAWVVGRVDAPGWGYGFQIVNNTVCNFRFGDGIYQITAQSNEWHHYVMTIGNSKVNIYKDGIRISSNNLPSTLPSYTVSGGIALGCFRYSSGNLYPYKGSLNDFRIYDHCLSAEQVKKISQGLILHYPLNNNGRGKPNLVPTDLTKWVKESGVTCIWDSSVKMYRLNTSSHSSSRWGIYYNITLQANKTYTFSVTGFKVSHTVGFGFAQTSGFPTAGPEFTSTKTRKSITITMGSSNANCRIYLYLYPSSGGSNLAYFGLPKLEEGAVETAYNFNVNDSQYTSFNLNDNMQADISGYGRNGIKNNITYDYLTKVKYGKSAIFNGNDSVITLGDISNLLQNEFTINLWFCKKDLGAKNYETLFGGPSGFEMDTRAGSETTLKLYMASNRGTLFTSFNFSNWYMVTMVCDNINQYYYINGNLVSTITKKGMPSGNYFIGAWRDASKQNYKGNMSDFRLYTTALSADDIKELYNYNNPIVIIEEEGQDVGQEPLV